MAKLRNAMASPSKGGTPTYWKKVSHQSEPMQEMADRILNTPSNNHNPIHAGFRFATDNIHVRYDGNERRNKDSASRWDCSEFLQHVVWAQNRALKAYATHNNLKLNTNFNVLENHVFPKASTTKHQRPMAEKHFGFIATGTGAAIEQQKLKEGMVIFQTFTPRKGSSYSGHVGMVVRDPETGKLMVAESTNARASVGVVIRTVHDFLNKGIAKVSRFYLSDPYAKDRPLLDAMSNKVEDIRREYHKANQEIGNTPSAMVKVSYRQHGVYSKEALIEKRIRSALTGGNQDARTNSVKHDEPEMSLLERLQNFNKPLIQQNIHHRLLPNLQRLSEAQEKTNHELDKPQLKMAFDLTKGIYS